MRPHVPMLALAAALLLLLSLVSPPAGAQQGEGEDEMREANRAASRILTDRLRRDRPKDYEALCRIRRQDLLVVRGQFDHVEWVLKEVGVPYAETSNLARQSLKGVSAVLVNCPGRIGGAGARRLKSFVEGGGFLFTTDWSVLNVLEPCFPGKVRYTRRPTRDDVVSIRVIKPEHLFLKHVLTGHDDHLWWLETQSYPIEILDRRNVEVLIESREMKQKYGEAPIAVTFKAGRGRVVHIVSHFYLQRSDLRRPRDRLTAKSFAGDLGFPASSPTVRRLEKEGLAKVEAGKLRSAYSAQQFLANMLIEATRGSARPPPPRPVPPRPVPPTPPPVVRGAHAARATVLRSSPGGPPEKAIPEGLRLSVIERRGDWLRVRTPAGETGWVAKGAVAE